MQNMNEKSTRIRYRDYSWLYEKANLEQGAYSLSDPGGNKVAVIYPADKTRPIDIPEKNAWLWVRHYGSKDWREAGCYALHEAIIHGSKHSDRYRAAEILDNLRGRIKRRRERDFEREM
jgi:hypothetical protein